MLLLLLSEAAVSSGEASGWLCQSLGCDQCLLDGVCPAWHCCVQRTPAALLLLYSYVGLAVLLSVFRSHFLQGSHAGTCPCSGGVRWFRCLTVCVYEPPTPLLCGLLLPHARQRDRLAPIYLVAHWDWHTAGCNCFVMSRQLLPLVRHLTELNLDGRDLLQLLFAAGCLTVRWRDSCISVHAKHTVGSRYVSGCWKDQAVTVFVVAWCSEGLRTGFGYGLDCAAVYCPSLKQRAARAAAMQPRFPAAQGPLGQFCKPYRGF